MTAPPHIETTRELLLARLGKLLTIEHYEINAYEAEIGALEKLGAQADRF